METNIVPNVVPMLWSDNIGFEYYHSHCTNFVRDNNVGYQHCHNYCSDLAKKNYRIQVNVGCGFR